MLLIKNGNLHLPGQQVLKEGDILIEGAYIKQIGKNLSDERAEVLDATGKEVFPGLILPLTSVGLTDYANLRQNDSNEISSPCHPRLHVRYALDGREVERQRYWMGGITSFGAAPANGALLAGQMGVYHITGFTASQMCVRDTVAVKGNFLSDVKSTFQSKGVEPMTRMGMSALLRRELDAAKRWMETGNSEYHADYVALAKVLRKEIPLLMNANTVTDIADVLEIGREYGIRLILNGVYEGHLVADLIEESNASVILGDLFDSGARIWYQTEIDKILSLREKQPVCIGCSSGGVGRENLLWNGCRLIQEGYSPTDVLDMMTVKTAEVLGVEDLIGSIQEGLFADLAIYNGNPLESWTADVQATLVAGKIVYQKEGGAVC